jgi:hypothetical protein
MHRKREREREREQFEKLGKAVEDINTQILGNVRTVNLQLLHSDTQKNQYKMERYA